MAGIGELTPVEWFSADGVWQRVVEDYFGPGRQFADVPLRSCPMLTLTPFACEVIEGFAAHQSGWRVPYDAAAPWWRRTMLALQNDLDARTALQRAANEDADG